MVAFRIVFLINCNDDEYGTGKGGLTGSIKLASLVHWFTSFNGSTASRNCDMSLDLHRLLAGCNVTLLCHYDVIFRMLNFQQSLP